MDTAGPIEKEMVPGDSDVHVWTSILRETPQELADFECLLNREEKKRADRFVRVADRSRYVAAHGILRQLLSRYLGTDPRAHRFVTNEFGKPALAPTKEGRRLWFNLAHSGELVLIAFANRQVGVDVERIRTDIDVMSLAQGQFADREIAALTAIESIERVTAFFRCWTRKEAYLKARGEGLSFALKQFAVSFGRSEAPSVCWVAGDPLAPSKWSLIDLSLFDGYAGALAIEGVTPVLYLKRWR
jgi:4'-phosphopantetheinyl transferase